MPLLYYIQNSVIGLAITLLIYAHAEGYAHIYGLVRKYGHARKHKNIHTDGHACLDMRAPCLALSQKIFHWLLLSNMALLFLEMLLNICSGLEFAGTGIFIRAVVGIFYIMNPVPEALWILYLEATIKKEESKNSKGLVAIISLPFAVNGIFTIISLFRGFLFSVDSGNVYHRGPYFWIMPVICYLYVFYYLLLIFLKRDRILRHEFTVLLYIAMPPIIAGILQSLFYGLDLLWISLSFSLLINYMNLQSAQVYMDHLTGLANRRKFDLLMRNLEKRQKNIGGIMIDINGFKGINDTYGHDTGDKVLENMGRILRYSLSRGDFAARIGGDEFVLLVEADTREELEGIVCRIQESVAQFNRDSSYPFELSVSLGYDLWDVQEGYTQEQFFKRIDQKMYAEKKRRGQEREKFQ